MNLTETLQIMAVIRSEYPDFCRGCSQEDIDRKAALWQEMFSGDDAGLVGAAVKAIIASDQREFAPKISHIKEAMRRLTDQDELDEDEAWQLLRKAVSRSGYGAQKEYDQLPEELQRMCSPGQLYEWSQMDSDVFNSVVASHFRKTYRARRDSRRRDALLPTDVKRFLAGFSERTALEAGGKEALP